MPSVGGLITLLLCPRKKKKNSVETSELFTLHVHARFELSKVFVPYILKYANIFRYTIAYSH